MALPARQSAIFALLLLSAFFFSLASSKTQSAAAGECQTPNFAVVVTPNIGGSLFSLAVGDLNGDLKPDVVTAGYYDDKLSFLLGDGAGNFIAAGSTTTVQRPAAVALGDFNQDGKLDLAVARDFSTSVSVLLGTGTGNFSAPVGFTVGTNPIALVLADFNNDGKLDIATGNDGSNTISILLGNGVGSFRSAPSLTNVRPSSLVAADFNHDNKLDLAAANTNNNKVTVFLGDGGGGFGVATHFDGGSALQGIAVADFNGDTHPDIAVTNYSDCCTPAFVAVLLGNGSGAFSTPTKFTAPFGPRAIAVADFNGDGQADVATANVQQTSSNISVMLGNGTGSLGLPTTFNIGTAPYALVTADINLDSVPDLVATNYPSIAALLNACGGAPTPSPTATPTPSPTPVASPTPPLGAVVISQIYSGSGQVGSSYRYNYVELFNRTNEVIDINGWPISAASAAGNSGFSIGFVSSSGVYIGGGQYLLIQIGPAGASGAPLPVTPDFTIDQNIELAGRLAFSRAGTFLSGSCPTLPNSNIIDYVGYGTAATCFEGAGPTANLAPNTAAVRLSGGCTDTDNNANDFIVSAPAPHNSGSTRNFCSPEPPKVQLTQSLFNVTEGGGGLGLVVTRTGNTSGVSTVDYATSDTSGAGNCNVVAGHASARCDYIAEIGTLQFAPGETYKLISIPLIDDTYAEGTETFFVGLSNLTGATPGPITNATISINDNEASNGINPLDNTGFFVRQQYLDFLNREPDSAGYSYWNADINNCTPKPQCTALKHINVSAAFFLSIEFQETGYLVYRTYKAAYGSIPDTPVPLTFNEFLPDTQRISQGVIVNATGWEQQLDANKNAFFLDFISRLRFRNDYPNTMTPAQFVDLLFSRAAVTPSKTDRDAALAEFGSAVDTANTDARRRALRRVSENSILAQQERNPAFVLMQYFGYLRRNPNAAPEPGLNFDGFHFWLGKLNQFNGNFINADMVQAFIVSSEYRGRFGP